MANLPKFTLTKNEEKDRWELEHDKTGTIVKSWDTKADATAGGVLRKAIGGEGSVKIQKENGKFQEERTFPRSEDPRQVEGLIRRTAVLVVLRTVVQVHLWRRNGAHL